MSPMSGQSLVRDAFFDQAKWCERLGSPLTARLMEGLGRSLDEKTATGKGVLNWQGPPDGHGDSVPLRLAGALHALVRRGRLPGLAALYPPNDLPESPDLAVAAMEAIADADEEILSWLEFAPQTNEVARSAVLYPGLMIVAAHTGLPLSLFELGASAGLNLIPDRYAYRLGGAPFGDMGSPLLLEPGWSGPVPDGIDPQILHRRGCDRNPLDVSTARDRERLVAYVWPDQAMRLERVETAIELARENPPVIDKADAADWVDAVIGTRGHEGVARVLLHSIAFQYFPEETKRRIAEKVEYEGSIASRASPLAWLAYEQYESEGPRLILRLWPGNEEHVLAHGDAHGRSIRWLG